MLAVTYEPFALGMIGAAVPVVLGAWFVRRKTKAETADLITEAAGRLVQHLENQIKDLRNELATERAERAALNIRLAQSETREAVQRSEIASQKIEIRSLHTRITLLTEELARYEAGGKEA